MHKGADCVNSFVFVGAFGIIVTKWVWDRVTMYVFEVKAAAMNLLNDWRQELLKNTKSKPVLNTNTSKWNLPPHGWVKVDSINGSQMWIVLDLGV